MSRLPHFPDNRFTDGGEIVSLLSALRAGRRKPPETFLVLICVRGLVSTGATLRLEGLGQLNIPVTSTRSEPETFRLVAQCLNQLHHHVAPSMSDNEIIIVFHEIMTTQ
jgi:hypothetical protein